jgi:hypothetical protein
LWNWTVTYGFALEARAATVNQPALNNGFSVASARFLVQSLELHKRGCDCLMEAYPEDSDPSLIGELKVFNTSVKMAYLDYCSFSIPDFCQVTQTNKEKE